MSSHALLLRLFLSHFNVHLALQYLALYPDNIGITYYITRRLRELPVEEVRDVWEFFCHLLITRPSKSRALECFVVDMSERSTHVAMLTLWFMQATLTDLAVAKRNTPSFAVCQRVLHCCHEIIFGDPPPQTVGPYSSTHLALSSRFSRRKVRQHGSPALIGMAMVLAAAPGIPSLVVTAGEMAIEQGRVEAGNSLESAEDAASPAGYTLTPQDEDDQDVEFASPDDLEATSRSDSSPEPESSTTPPGPFTTRWPSHSAVAIRTSPALPLQMANIMPRSRASIDPLGQLDHAPMSVEPSPSQSSPSVAVIKRHRLGLYNSVDAAMHRYDLSTQMNLLRGHYCRSEVQFLLALENIANRLLVIPRPARVSALRAELTAMNHKLPAEVCMPLWCTSSDKPQGLPAGVPQPHHRIVRIPPGESVVLNSAERAPYVLMLEVLSGDLDFNPMKRSNKEVLKKIITREHEKKGSSQGLTTFSSSVQRTPSLPQPNKPPTSDEPDPMPRMLELSAENIPPTPSESVYSVDADQEVDLVEQLYGSEKLSKTQHADLSESIVLPPAPKNKDLDAVAWARTAGSSRPGTPRLETTPRFGPPPPADATTPPGLSLEEYSERMRMAAVMLAQLNLNQMPENPQMGRAGGGPATAPTHGPVHPSLRGATPNAATKSKLNHTEAAVIRDRIMKEMLDLEEERMARMREDSNTRAPPRPSDSAKAPAKTIEDESIIRRELDKADPSAAVFSESWAAKKSRVRQASPYGHLASWDLFSCIVKTGGDLRQEQLATHLIQAFGQIWAEESCQCWVRYFRILATSGDSGLVETITDAVSIHSIKKAEYGRRLAEGRLGHVSLMDHFKATYGDPSLAKFARAQLNFAKSLAGYSVVSYLLQLKDRHNGNILLDRDGHLIHIDFGFMLSNSPGNIGFEAAPFKLPMEWIEVLGGMDSPAYQEFRRLFLEGFLAARKHCDRIITLVELMQKESSFPCFAALGEQTAAQLRDRFQPTLTHSLIGGHVDRLIDSSIGSHYTRLYDAFQYYSQSIL